MPHDILPRSGRPALSLPSRRMTRLGETASCPHLRRREAKALNSLELWHQRHCKAKRSGGTEVEMNDLDKMRGRKRKEMKEMKEMEERKVKAMETRRERKGDNAAW